MRKLMLSLVFVLGAMTMVNANAGLEKSDNLLIQEVVELPPTPTFADCDGYANVAQFMLGITYEEANFYFELCMEKAGLM